MATTAMKPDELGCDPTPRTFKYVEIPFDSDFVEHDGDGTKAVTDFADDIRPKLVPKGTDPTDILREALESGALTPEQVAQVDIMKLSGSCEILALTVPTATNKSVAVSMYYNAHATAVNKTATALAHG